MTYSELIQYLENHLKYSLLHGKDVANALQEAESGSAGDALASEVLLSIFRANHCSGTESEVNRADSFSGLAPLRLRSQADDADASLFRQVLQLSENLDRAFDEESLRQKSGA